MANTPGQPEGHTPGGHTPGGHSPSSSSSPGVDAGDVHFPDKHFPDRHFHGRHFPGAAATGGGGMQPVSGRKPVARKISVRSVSFALSGLEREYPVYQFSRRAFFERTGHNPFDGL